MSISSVMIVDDSEPDQFIAKNNVEKFDNSIEVLQAYDGQEALEILAELPTQPDFIFLDINMPRMNGHEFLEEYETWEDNTVVVVMLTSSDQEQDKEKSLAYTCVKKYFSKPLDQSLLVDVVDLLP
ncbi:MAG: response regulator [Pseudomonadales bacterium]|nr:response regulator [Pseudomonadales bacterium]